MIQRLRVGNLPLPKVYVADTSEEYAVLGKKGLPRLLRPEGMGDETIAKYALLYTLRKMFPNVHWREFFGIDEFSTIIVDVPGGDAAAHQSGDDSEDAVHIADIAEDDRYFSGGAGEDYGERPLDKYVGDMSAYVSIEELQALHMLPAFLDDIATAIRKNLYGLQWTEGYNKKRGFPLGNFDAGQEKKNLIILDVSGSIPRGVSATMLTLIATLKEHANAALIVTGSTSYWWDVDEQPWSPQEIRDHVGYGNESDMFMDILRNHIAGNRWGNVIVFGDGDRPLILKHSEEKPDYSYRYESKLSIEDFAGTQVDNLLSFHTGRNYERRVRGEKNQTPGYAKWIREIGLEPPEEVNTAWCRFMD